MKMFGPGSRVVVFDPRLYRDDVSTPTNLYWPGQGERRAWIVTLAPHLSFAEGQGETEAAAWRNAAAHLRMRAMRRDGVFRAKSEWQKDNCITDCGDDSTLEAIYGNAAVRCCQKETCKAYAAWLAHEANDALEVRA